MAVFKHYNLKKRLIKFNRRTKWAPVWVVLKKFGKGKKVHPSYFSRKRSWRRTRIRI